MGWQRAFRSSWVYFYWPWFFTNLPMLYDRTAQWTAINFLVTCNIARERASGHLFTSIFSSALAQVHSFDFSTALQYWFWRELVSSVLLKIWPVWFLRDLFSLLPHNFILTCHSWSNWHCTISNRRDAVLEAGENQTQRQPWQKTTWRRESLG